MSKLLVKGNVRDVKTRDTTGVSAFWLELDVKMGWGGFTQNIKLLRQGAADMVIDQLYFFRREMSRSEIDSIAHIVEGGPRMASIQ